MPELAGDPNQHDTSKFDRSITGSCLCGNITVTITDDELFTKPRGHLCHCSNCRKVSGSFVSSNLLLEEDKVFIEDRDGTLKKYVDMQTGSGNAVYRYFCGTCGNPIKSVAQMRPGKVIVKMGMFPRIPKPECETFGNHRHEWQGKHDGLDRYQTQIFGEKMEA